MTKNKLQKIAALAICAGGYILSVKNAITCGNAFWLVLFTKEED